MNRQDHHDRLAVELLRSLHRGEDSQLDATTIGQLLDELRSAKAGEARLAIARALLGSRDPRVPDALRALLRDRIPEVRLFAVRALADDATPATATALAAAAEDNDPAVRAEVALVRHHVGDAGSQPARGLIAFLQRFKARFVGAKKGFEPFVASGKERVQLLGEICDAVLGSPAVPSYGTLGGEPSAGERARPRDLRPILAELYVPPGTRLPEGADQSKAEVRVSTPAAEGDQLVGCVVVDDPKLVKLFRGGSITLRTKPGDYVLAIADLTAKGSELEAWFDGNVQTPADLDGETLERGQFTLSLVHPEYR